MQASATSNKILPVTSIRFLAALFIVLFHVGTGGETTWLRNAGILRRILALGYTSVSFFFFLSGFVLAITYCDTSRAVSTRKFLVSRFARIYPALAACLLFDLPHAIYAEINLFHHGPAHIFAMLLVSFTALEAWFPHLPGLDPPSWSISVETFFYLLFPFVAMRIWRMAPLRMWAFATGLYVLGNVLVLDLIHRQVWIVAMGYNPVTHLPEFLTGICLAKLFLAMSANPQSSERLARYAPTALFVSASGFLAIPIFRLPIPEMLLQHGVLLPLYGLAILALASGHKTITAVLSQRWLVMLGEASFALYLIHLPLFALLNHFIAKAPSLGVPLGVGLAVALSILSFLFLETPARRYILRRAHTRPLEDNVIASMAQ